MGPVLEEIKVKVGIKDKDEKETGEDNEEEQDEEDDDGEQDLADEADKEEAGTEKKDTEAETLDPALLHLLGEVEENVDVRLEAANEARSQFKALEDQEKELKNSLTDLEKTNSFDFGPNQELYPLKGKCFSKHVNQYEYEMCPYDTAKQKENGNHGVSLGKWEKLQRHDIEADPNGPVYTFSWKHGQHCWNGPERSCTAHVRCGMTDEVLSVDEPSMCEVSVQARQASVWVPPSFCYCVIPYLPLTCHYPLFFFSFWYSM